MGDGVARNGQEMVALLERGRVLGTALHNTFKIMFKTLCSVMMAAKVVMAFTTSINKVRTHDMSHTNTITPLSVAVYQPDDMGTYTVMDESSANNIFDSFNNNYETDLDECIYENIALQLSYDPSITSTLVLARLASKYAPTGYDIDITNINEVRLQKLDSSSISIETIICEANECAALLVPITFAEECVLDDTLRECVLHNMHTLDIKGDEPGEEKENIFKEEKEALKAYDVLQSFDIDELKTELNGCTLPEWWVSPTSTEDISECELIEELLNGSDFQSVLRSLALYMLPSERRLGTVAIKLVGCRGMLLKVELRQGNTIDVPVKYLHTGHDESRSIREQVLLVVSSISTPLHE